VRVRGRFFRINLLAPGDLYSSLIITDPRNMLYRIVYLCFIYEKCNNVREKWIDMGDEINNNGTARQGRRVM